MVSKAQNLRTFMLMIHLLATSVVALLAQDTPLSLTVLDEYSIPSSTTREGILFGGISGISYDSESNLYYAISDDRAERGPLRFYTLSITIDEASIQAVEIMDMITLMDVDNSEFGANAADPEAIRFLPNSQTILWASEKDRRGNTPLLREASLDGNFVRDYTIPDIFVRSGGNHGIQENSAFEAMDVSPDESTIIIGTESALMQDGEPSTIDTGSPARIWLIDRETGETIAQYVYPLEAIPVEATLPPYSEDNGLSELVYVDETHFIAIERSFALGYGNTINIYLANLAGATDVQAFDSIEGMDFVAITKTHLLTLNEETDGIDVDNIEGATWGPTIDGQRTLLLISDNNFNPVAQPYTEIILLAVD